MSTEIRTLTDDQAEALLAASDERHQAAVDAAWAAYQRGETTHREYEQAAARADRTRATEHDAVIRAL